MPKVKRARKLRVHAALLANKSFRPEEEEGPAAAQAGVRPLTRSPSPSLHA